jgi:hypothetical protein
MTVCETFGLFIITGAAVTGYIIGDHFGGLGGGITGSAVGILAGITIEKVIWHMKLREGPKPPSIPCPYCGEMLRTGLAKQCFKCGADWHNAAM